MLTEITTFIVNTVEQFWYLGIFIMMTIESSAFIPFPSEVAMIPAGYLASIGKMNIYLAFLAGTLWAMLWATINYFLGKTLGWPATKALIKKFWKYVFVSLKHYELAERFFQKHGAITTFNGRLIPAVRQLISLPAWVFKMHFWKFLFFTTLGAGIWNAILLWIWYIAWENKAIIAEYSKEAIIWCIVFIVIASICYYFFQKYFQKQLQEEITKY